MQDARPVDVDEKTKALGFGRQLESRGNGFGTKGEKAAGLKGNTLAARYCRFVCIDLHIL